MMVAVSTSETSVNFYQITRHNNPEDGHLDIQNKFIHVQVQENMVNMPVSMMLCVTFYIQIFIKLSQC
jgi:hypothetical protein